MYEVSGPEWGVSKAKFSPDETNNDLRQPLSTGVYPYIPKGRQKRSGLLVDFLALHGASAGKNHIDLLMLGENRYGVLLINLPSSIGASDEDLAVLKSALRDKKSSSSAAETLRALDKFFSESLPASAGVQAFYSIFDQQKRAVNFSSAAHTPMLLFRPDDKKVFRLGCEGNALGLSPQAYKDFNGQVRNTAPSLVSENVKIRQHDLLIMHSPGVVDATNAWGEPFGLQRFLKVIIKYGHMQPTPFLVELQNALEQFTMGEPYKYDTTAVALKNMLPDVPPNGHIIDEVQDRFLTVDEEGQLQKSSEKHPEARVQELTNLLGARYQSLGEERVRYYLTSGSKHGLTDRERKLQKEENKRFESLEKYLQRQLLQSFPIRELLYRKYEFRGNTTAIQKALDFYQKGDFQQSLVEFIKVRKAIADSESVFCFFGNLYLLLNLSIKARQEYMKALQLNPRCVHAFLALGYISLIHGDYDGTIYYLSTALRFDNDLEIYEKFLADLVKSLDKQSGLREWVA